MEEKCKTFNRDRYMEEYDAHIELNSTLRGHDITDPHGSYIYSSWINKNYDNNYCLPSVHVDDTSRYC